MLQDESILNVEVEPEANEAKQTNNNTKSDDGVLSHFQLKPAGLKGNVIFRHMLKCHGEHVSETNPSDYSGIEVSST